MHEYLQSKPILWVKSSVYLNFLTRRMQELKNLQVKLFKRPTSNYRTVTTLIMHLIRHTIITTKAAFKFLRDALVDINFRSIIGRHGMFFLHNLDLTTGKITDLPRYDSQEAEQVLKHAKMKRQPVEQTENTCPTTHYPLGPAPAWSEVVANMSTQPELLIKEWMWDPTWGQHCRASRLFTLMTADMWLTVSDVALTTAAP